MYAAIVSFKDIESIRGSTEVYMIARDFCAIGINWKHIGGT